jgi:hypothetical protein
MLLLTKAGICSAVERSLKIRKMSKKIARARFRNILWKNKHAAHAMLTIISNFLRGG